MGTHLFGSPCRTAKTQIAYWPFFRRDKWGEWREECHSLSTVPASQQTISDFPQIS